MGRSIKKGPFVDAKLIAKIEAMNEKNEKVTVKTFITDLKNKESSVYEARYIADEILRLKKSYIKENPEVIEGFINAINKLKEKIYSNIENILAKRKNDNLDEEMTVELNLDDGTTVVCAIITILEVEGQDYIVLLPLDENGENEDGEVWFYRYSENPDDPNEEPELGFIDSDDEYEAVADEIISAGRLCIIP